VRNETWQANARRCGRMPGLARCARIRFQTLASNADATTTGLLLLLVTRYSRRMGRQRHNADSSAQVGKHDCGWRGHHQHFNPSQVHPLRTAPPTWRSFVPHSTQSPHQRRPSPEEPLTSLQPASITLSSNAWPAMHVSLCMFKTPAYELEAGILAQQG